MFLLGGYIHRMIFWELVRVFALSLTSLTGLFLVALVIQQANQLGLSLYQTLLALPLLVPYTLPYTIPATTLFATSVVYGRLAKDNETVALKAAGIDLLSILRPALLLGILTSAATFALSHSLIPRTQVQLQEQLLKDPEEVLYSMLKRERSSRSLGNAFPYVLHVKDVQGRRLIDVVLKRRKMYRDESGKEQWSGTYDFVVRAREARLRVEIPSRDQPNANSTLFIDPDRWVGGDDNLKIIGGANEPIGVPLPDIFNPKEVRDRPMNLDWDELPGKVSDFRDQLQKSVRDYEEARSQAVAELDPVKRKRYEDHAFQLSYVVGHFQRQIRNTESEYYMRPALALGCLVFALVGCPVGMWANRADYLSAFVTCFLPTVFLYYPILLAGRNMGQDGKIPMIVGVFLADIIGGIAAIFLIRKMISR